MLLENLNAVAEPVVRYFLGFYFLFIGIQFTARSLGLNARKGFSHIAYGPKATSGWWNRHIFNGFRAAILGVVVLRLFFPVDAYLGIFSSLYHGPLLLLGLVLLLSAYGVINYLQAFMHDDWRSGVHPDHMPQLLTTGPFSRSRNPVFLAVMLGQFGFFLALPSMFSLVCLIAGVFVLLRQARVEEHALLKTFGEDYLAYHRHVPRWL